MGTPGSLAWASGFRTDAHDAGTTYIADVGRLGVELVASTSKGGN
jgi:hypothetical protein